MREGRQPETERESNSCAKESEFRSICQLWMATRTLRLTIEKKMADVTVKENHHWFSHTPELHDISRSHARFLKSHYRRGADAAVYLKSDKVIM